MLQYFFRLERISPPLREYSQLEEMLAHRALGWSYTALADKYGVEKTTIRYLCRKFGLAEKSVETIVFRMHPRTTILPPPEPVELRINPGKTYAEYLKEDQERRKKVRTTFSAKTF